MKNLIVITSLIAVILASFLSPQSMFNPGELITGHWKIKNDCEACHKYFGGIDAEKCIACHQLNEIGMDTFKINPGADKKGVHLFHDKLKSQQCTQCHTDHKGLNHELSLGKFSHTFLADEIKAQCMNCHIKPKNLLHEKLSVSCENCHDTKNWKTSGTFNHSMIQDTIRNSCFTCHQKPADNFHDAFMGDNCDKCHNTSKWTPSNFDHSAYFVLDNNHKATCNTCHTNKNYATYTCYNCHEHSASKINEEHSEHGISDLTNCVSCHKSGNEHEIRGMEGKGKNTKESESKKLKDYIDSRHKEKDKQKENDDD